MLKNHCVRWTTAVVLMLLAPAIASAAFITVDDSDLANITITAGDFEGGFSIDGVLLTTGLGNSGTITFPDSGHTIDGSWIDLGLASGARVDALFAFPSDPTLVTSGIEFGASSDGTTATLTGSFGGLTGFPYFTTALATANQDGHTELFSMPFLSGSFTSELPEPATLVMLATALPVCVFALRRRRRSA